MEILLYVDGALLLTLFGIVGKLGYSAGLLQQKVKDQEAEINRMRDRLDAFLDPHKYEGKGGC